MAHAQDLTELIEAETVAPGETSAKISATVSIPISTVDDVDDDGLGDAWELSYFGDLSQGADADSDNDGLSNYQARINQVKGECCATVKWSARGGLTGKGPSIPALGGAKFVVTVTGQLSGQYTWCLSHGPNLSSEDATKITGSISGTLAAGLRWEIPKIKVFGYGGKAAIEIGGYGKGTYIFNPSPGDSNWSGSAGVYLRAYADVYDGFTGKFQNISRFEHKVSVAFIGNDDDAPDF